MAAKLLTSTELSAVKARCMLPNLVVTALGRLLPLKDPSRVPALLVPSYTLTKSKLCSVVNLLKLRVMAEPVEIVHEHA